MWEDIDQIARYPQSIAHPRRQAMPSQFEQIDGET
jgi:hypothetical protein